MRNEKKKSREKIIELPFFLSFPEKKIMYEHTQCLKQETKFSFYYSSSVIYFFFVS